MAHILIIVALVTTTGYMRGDEHSTRVTTERFDTLEACRAAANEIARQNNGHGTLRMSCVPAAHQPAKEPSK